MALLPRQTFDSLDRLILLGLAVAVVLHSVLTFDFQTIPFEDAAILMRFADHMAQGHGIIWNIGEKPVDGATDFLFLATLGFLGMFGLDIHHAVYAVGLGSHWITCLFVYFAARTLHAAPRWTGILSAAYLAVGPAHPQVEAYFGAPYFALFAGTTWYLGYLVFLRRDTVRTPVWFALSSLALGMIRPEGVFLSVYILAATLVVAGWQRCRRLILTYLLLFGGLGATYFFWRWSYFGYPLPNPFYVKGGGSLYPFSLIDSVMNVARLGFPFLPLIAYATVMSARRLVCSPLRAKYVAVFGVIGVGIGGFGVWMLAMGGAGDARDVAVRWCTLGAVSLVAGPWLLARVLPLSSGQRVSLPDERDTAATYLALPLFGFTFQWLLLSAIMNYLERFQYALLPLLLISWPGLLVWLLDRGYLPSLARLFPRARWVPTAAAAVFSVACVAYFVQRYHSYRVMHGGTYDVAVMLADYKDAETTMIVTSAGHLPYYSGWRAIDAWGLSDQVIAHDGLDLDYVAAANPHVIQFEGPLDPAEPGELAAFEDTEWHRATVTLRTYAEREGYELAAAFGLSPQKVHFYYVRPDWPRRDEVVARIRTMPYHWFTDPRGTEARPVATNFVE